MVKQIDVYLRIFLLKFLLMHEIFLLAVVVSLLRTVLDESDWLLVLVGYWLLGPVMVESGFGDHAIEPELLFVSCGLDVTQNWLFYVGVVEKLLLETGLVLGREVGSRIAAPIVWLSVNEPTDQFSIVSLIIFGIFDIFHIRNNTFRVETMFLSSSELFLRKFLTLDSSLRKFCNLSEMNEIAWTRIVGLGGMVTCYFFFGVVWTLELFYLLVFVEWKEEIFDRIVGV